MIFFPREVDGTGYGGEWMWIWSFGCGYLDVDDHLEERQGCVDKLCTQVFVVFWGRKVTDALGAGEVC